MKSLTKAKNDSRKRKDVVNGYRTNDTGAEETTALAVVEYLPLLYGSQRLP